MKQLLYVFFFGGLIMASSCTEKFKKGPKGSEYKIIKDGSGPAPTYGQYIMFETKKYLNRSGKDTLFGNTRDAMAEILPLDSMQMPPQLYKYFSQMRKGDSLVIRTLVDSLVPPGQKMPDFAKKGQLFYETYKLTEVFKDMDAVRAGAKIRQNQAIASMNAKEKAEFEKEYAAGAEQLKIDDKIITDYLAKNNITNAVKTKLGTYVVIKEPGTGDLINDSSVVKVNYTGKSLDGKIFDSNLDPAFKRPGSGPYPVYMIQFGGVIVGWKDGLRQLRNGSKATFLIPSVMAYGKSGRAPTINPNQVLMFDIEIPEVTTFAEEVAKAEEEQRKNEEMQLRMQDSLKAAQTNQPPPHSEPKK